MFVSLCALRGVQYKKSVHNRAFGGARYDDLPRPNASPPPSIRTMYNRNFQPRMELLPALEPPAPRAEGPGLFDDWSDEVRSAAGMAEATIESQGELARL